MARHDLRLPGQIANRALLLDVGVPLGDWNGRLLI